MVSSSDIIIADAETSPSAATAPATATVSVEDAPSVVVLPLISCATCGWPAALSLVTSVEIRGRLSVSKFDGLKYHSDTFIESGHETASNNRVRSSSKIHSRNAFRSYAFDSALPFLRRLGWTSKQESTSTDKLETNERISSTEHTVLTLSTQKTAFFLILFAALILALLIREALPTSDD